MSGEALYNQGMAYYRRRQWQKARESFQRLKRVDPGRRGIDALLDELDIFIRLETLQPTGFLRAPLTPEPAAAADLQAEAAAQPRPSPLLLVSLGGVAILVTVVLLVYGLINPWATQRKQELRSLGQAYRAARNWSKAIEAYEEWLLLAPDDPEARHGLWVAYYERGDQRAAEALRLEEEEQEQAAERWQRALADFRAAHEVHPNHEPDPRGQPLARVGTAEQHRRWALLLIQAQRLQQERRWPEAIQTLQALRDEAPDYCSAQVQSCLGAAYLESGHEALAKAETLTQVRQSVQLIEEAWRVQPASPELQAHLQRARAYLRAVAALEEGQWQAGVEALQALLQEEPGYAGGRGADLHCQARMHRAEEQYRAGQARDALSEYQAVLALGCAQEAEAQRKAQEIALALTPTATPTPLPTRPPTPTPVLAEGSEPGQAQATSTPAP